MTSRDFCYWLQGYIELRPGHHDTLTAEQLECVRKHIALGFKHEIDPSYGAQKHQDSLNAIHNPPVSGLQARR